jgi:hypothetical protein
LPGFNLTADFAYSGGMGSSDQPPVLVRGELVPHFEVTTVGGETVRYSTIWQRLNLVLIALPDSDSEEGTRYVAAVQPFLEQLGAMETSSIVTRGEVAGVPAPGVLIADRWGEIAFVAAAQDFGSLPAGHDLVDWVDYVRRQCPECQGEVR